MPLPPGGADERHARHTLDAIFTALPGRQLRPSAMNAMALWLFIGMTS